MKLKLILATAIVMTAVASPSGSSAAPSPPPPMEDSVTGGPALADSGPLPFFSVNTINATSGPTGEDPAGRVSFVFILRGPTSLFDGPVTCLAVSGNTATINFQDQVTLVGSIITVRVVDDQPDTFGAASLGRAPTDCSSPLLGQIIEKPLSSGDITVVDAPTPTNKEQCTHGGWKLFGFKNQGQCIAFVNHSL
jgi:hypothetical protein